MPKVELSKEKIVEVLEAQSPKSLTEIYRHLGGQGKLSGSTAKTMRSLVPDIEERVAKNKAAVTVKSEPVQKDDATSHPSEKSKKVFKKPAKATKSSIPRHTKNPFRPGSGYGLILDIIADAGAKGIGKPDLLKAYCKASGKDLTHAMYDLAVINSAAVGRTRHRSMKDGVTVILDGANYQVSFN